MNKVLYIILISLFSLTIFSCAKEEEKTEAPVIAEVYPVTTPTSDPSPNYTFSSTKAGTITYGGSCSSGTTSATSGNNTITFTSLSAGTYSDCTIIVTDSDGNASNTLAVTTFIYESGITYPDNGTYGKNLLSDKEITISTSTGIYYSLRVDKKVDSTVKVIFPIPKSSSHMWWWYPSELEQSGWYEGSGSSGTLGGYRNFITNSGTLYSDLKIFFTGSDNVTIEIYENGVTTPTRTKIISW